MYENPLEGSTKINKDREDVVTLKIFGRRPR